MHINECNKADCGGGGGGEGGVSFWNLGVKKNKMAWISYCWLIVFKMFWQTNYQPLSGNKVADFISIKQRGRCRCCFYFINVKQISPNSVAVFTTETWNNEKSYNIVLEKLAFG